MEIDNDLKMNLIENAIEARKNAYTPYSHFLVGAALLTKQGKIYTGCNIENASYGATNCAERTAFFKAVSEGDRDFTAIAIVGGKNEDMITTYAYPCGICRQVMMEFCNENFLILIARSQEDFLEYRLHDLLPFGFGGDHLS